VQNRLNQKFRAGPATGAHGDSGTGRLAIFFPVFIPSNGAKIAWKGCGKKEENPRKYPENPMISIE
jgi:hypothetical protein